MCNKISIKKMLKCNTAHYCMKLENVHKIMNVSFEVFKPCEMTSKKCYLYFRIFYMGLTIISQPRMKVKILDFYETRHIYAYAFYLLGAGTGAAYFLRLRLPIFLCVFFSSSGSGSKRPWK